MKGVSWRTMQVIGITGPSGAGKSLLCRFLKNNSIPCIDADGVYHSLLVPPSECLDAIERVFGSAVIARDGSLDRAALAAVVFADKEKLETLNATVLDYVLEEIRAIIEDYRTQGYSVVAVDAPTLIESGFNKECTRVLSVLASPDVRIKRIIERDGLSESAASARINAQKKDDFYIGHSDGVIYNDCGESEFIIAAQKTLSDILYTQKEEEHNA